MENYIPLEIIITSGGENIPPVNLEANILREIPFLSNVMIIGDKRKYLTCLMTLKVGAIRTLSMCACTYVIFIL